MKKKILLRDIPVGTVLKWNDSTRARHELLIWKKIPSRGEISMTWMMLDPDDPDYTYVEDEYEPHAELCDDWKVMINGVED